MNQHEFDMKRLEYNLNRDKNELRETLEFLQSQITQALKALDDEQLFGLNELGIFQGNSSRADALAAKVKLENRILKELQHSNGQ